MNAPHPWQRAFRAGLALVAALCVALATPAPALGQPEARATFRQAVERDDAGDYAGALPLYEQAIEQAPNARFVRRARARIDALSTLATDPALSALDTLKRDPTIPAAEARQRAEALLDVATTPAGTLAVTAWIAENGLANGDDDSVDWLCRVATHPAASPGDIEGSLFRATQRATTLEEIDRIRAAIVEVRAARPELMPEVTARAWDETRDARQRRVVKPVSIGSLLLLLALAGVRRGSGVRVLPKLSHAMVVVYAFGGGAVLAEMREVGKGAPFTAAIVPLLLVHVLARAARPPEGASRANRVLTASLIVVATVGAVYLTFDFMNQPETLGL